MIVWPATLPQRFEVDGYQESMGDGRLRSQTESGFAKVRRRFSIVPRPLAAILVLSSDELAIFEAFVRDTLAGGALPFQMPRQAGRGTGTWIVQMAENMPSWTSTGAIDQWRVTLDLVILP